MSYSRWGHSDWYAFWNCSSGKEKGNQILSLWLARGLQLDHSFEDIEDWTVFDVMNIYRVDLELANGAMDIINSFKEDVELEF